MRWPEDLVIDFADQCKVSDYKLSLTGSWIGDQQDYKTFWLDVYLWWLIERSQEQVVENTLEWVNSDA